MRKRPRTRTNYFTRDANKIILSLSRRGWNKIYGATRCTAAMRNSVRWLCANCVYPIVSRWRRVAVIARITRRLEIYRKMKESPVHRCLRPDAARNASRSSERNERVQTRSIAWNFETDNLFYDNCEFPFFINNFYALVHAFRNGI